MSPGLARLLLAACAALAAFALSAILLFQARRRTQALDGRIEAVAGPHRASGRPTAGFGVGLQAAGLAGGLERLLGFDPGRPHVYGPSPLKAALTSAIAALAGAWVLAGTVGPLVWPAAPVAAVSLCRAYYARREGGFQAKLYLQFPDALAMIVRAVRVGLPVVEAVRVVSRESQPPTTHEFAALVSQTSIGVPLEGALREMAERNRLPEYRFFATALSLQSQTGGALTETLENLADTIRKRVAAKQRGHALAAEARMSSYILGALPIVTGVLLWLVNPDYISTLFTDPSGRMLLFAGIGLLTMGALTMRTMIKKSLS